MSKEIPLKVESIGVAVMRYGLVAILVLIGLAKFTQDEATGIQPLVAHSPFMAWMYSFLSVSGVSRLIGVIEIITALLIASYPLSRKISLLGSSAAVLTFLLTSSFLFSTPGAIQLRAGISILGAASKISCCSALRSISPHRHSVKIVSLSESLVFPNRRAVCEPANDMRSWRVSCN
jgi:reactive chlorine resistance protein C